MRTRLREFTRDDSGQDLVEYGLLACFVVVASITSVSLLGGSLGLLWTGIVGELEGLLGG